MGVRALAERGAFVPDIAPSREDINLAGRLVKAYRRALSDTQEETSRSSDVWTEIKIAQGGYLGVLQNGDAGDLATYLCNMSRTDATIGTGQGSGQFARLLKDERYRRHKIAITKDKLVSFAEAVGVLACESPEQGAWGELMHIPADDILARLELTIGIALSPPAIDGGLFKMITDHGLFHERDLCAQFTAWSVRELVGLHGRVIEVGGGVGRGAYWGNRMGIEHYTIVDLPHVNVLQGFYLLKSVGSNSINLYGETNFDAPI